MTKIATLTDIILPVLPPDAPPWAKDLLTALAAGFRGANIREDEAVLEGVIADIPSATGSKRFFWASDTNRLYYDEGSWVIVTPQPSSSTDHAVARYDGTDGSLQDSLVTIDDSGSINIPSGQTYDINGTPLSKSDIGLGNVTNDLQVKQSGTQTIADVKTFSSIPVLPSSDPTTDDQAARKAYVDQALLAANYMRYSDHKSSGTAGGGSTSGNWYTRDLNTEEADPGSLGSLSSNRISLGAGDYYVRAVAPFWCTQVTRIRIYNYTDSAVLVTGHNFNASYAASVDYQGAIGVVQGYFTLSGTKEIELQYRCGLTAATSGLGVACSFGDDEIYSIVELWKVG